jgi:sigma-E factor negative regulatory protein RseA
MSDIPPHAIHDESLSALMDGEAQELELRRLLQQFPGDSALRAKWARYHVASSVIHKQHLPVVSLDLANAVRSAIEDGMQSEKGAGHMWRKGATRFAIAASVALAVVTGVQWQQQKTAVSGQLAAVPSPALNHVNRPSVESVAVTPFTAAKSLESSAFLQSRDQHNERYMQFNLEHASLDMSKGLTPLVPVAEKSIKNK